MLAVQGIYDGVAIKPKEAIPFNKEYEVVITFLYPVEEKQRKKKSAFGCFSEYADASKIPLEKGAWEKEVIKKYAIN